MKISIIIPTYNCGQYIKKAIDSVLAQSYEDKELIVIDGGSTDNTQDILKSYQDKISWISEKDNGQADAINKGFKISSGDIVAWLNADDYYENNIFGLIVSTFSENQDISIVYGKCQSVFAEKIIINNPLKNINFRKLINRGNLIYQPASFYRKKIVEKVNYLDDSFNYWMEYDLYIKLLKNGRAKYLDKILANFLVRDDQKSNLKNLKGMDGELWFVARRNRANIFSKIYFYIIFNKLKSLFL